jgi:hypothetical protein
MMAPKPTMKAMASAKSRALALVTAFHAPMPSPTTPVNTRRDVPIGVAVVLRGMDFTYPDRERANPLADAIRALLQLAGLRPLKTTNPRSGWIVTSAMPRFMQPLAKSLPLWWRGIAGTPVQLKQRSLPTASLSEKRRAEELPTGLQTAHQLPYGRLWIVEHVKAAVANNQVCLTVTERQSTHVPNNELDLPQGASLSPRLGAVQHLLGYIHSDVAHILIRAKSTQRHPAATRHIEDRRAVTGSTYRVHARVQQRCVDTPHDTTDQAHQPVTLYVEVIYGAKWPRTHVRRVLRIGDSRRPCRCHDGDITPAATSHELIKTLTGYWPRIRVARES